MWGTVIEGNLVILAHANAKTVPKSPAEAGVVFILEDHANAGTDLVLKNCIDKVTLILENHTSDETVHVCTGMLTGVQIAQKRNVHTTQLWTP